MKLKEKYFPLFSLKLCNNCILFPVDNLNVKLMKHIVHMGGRVRLYVSNRGSGQRFVGSDPREVTRGQLLCYPAFHAL